MEENQKPLDSLISYCGIDCSSCPLHRRNNCSCYELEGCKIAECVKEKGIKNCFYCEEFPCELHKKGFDWPKYHLEGFKPYSKEFLKMFENKEGE